MKVTILGCGVMGGLLAAYLSRGGADVTVSDPNPAVSENIRKRGLLATFDGVTETFHNVRAYTDPSQIGEEPDLIIFLMKNDFTAAACEQAHCIIGPKTEILSLQNGIGPVDVICEAYPGKDIMYGPMAVTGHIEEPGHSSVTVSKGFNITFGNQSKTITPIMEQFAAIVNAGGLRCRPVEDIEPYVWLKLSGNCKNAILALLRITIGTYATQEERMAINNLVTDELDAVMKAMGIEFPPPAPGTKPAVKGALSPALLDHLPSTAQDVKAHRKTEVAYINGAIVRAGRKYGVPTPVNEFITLLLQVIEKTYDKQF